MKSIKFATFAAALCFVPFVACSGGNNGGKGGGGGASAAEVSTCQEACDKQRFFDCYDAAQHGQCYDDCGAASSDDINKFDGCVENTICDAECAVFIEGKAAEVDEEDVVVTDKDPEPPASSCEAACDDLVGAMCFPSEDIALCKAACATDAETRFAIVYCNSTRTGCQFPDECTGEIGGGSNNVVIDNNGVNPNNGTSGDNGCSAGCDQLQFFDCIDASTSVACRNNCASADATTQQNFASCVQSSSGVCDEGCYTVLDPTFMGGGSANVSGCNMACDDMAFFDCIDAQTQSDCRTLCSTASASSVDTFIACNNDICDDDSCYTVFVNAN